MSDLNQEQADFFRGIQEGPRGRVPINLRAWIHNLPFARVAEPFGLYVSQTAPISKREKEIIILVNARHWEAEFEWAMHERHALAAGLAPDQIAAIKRGEDPAFDDVGERLSYRLAHALHERKRLDDRLYEECLTHFEHNGISDRIGLIGLYTMIAFTLNFYQVAPPSPETDRNSFVQGAK